MSISANIRHDIFINAMIEHERMFTVLGHLCADDPDKASFLAEIELTLKDCLKSFERTRLGQLDIKKEA